MLEEAFKYLHSLLWLVRSLQYFTAGLICPSKMELYIKVYLQVASSPAEFLKKHGNIRKVSELYGIGLMSRLPSTEKC